MLRHSLATARGLKILVWAVRFCPWPHPLSFKFKRLEVPGYRLNSMPFNYSIRWGVVTASWQADLKRVEWVVSSQAHLTRQVAHAREGGASLKRVCSKFSAVESAPST